MAKRVEQEDRAKKIIFTRFNPTTRRPLLLRDPYYIEESGVSDLYR